MMEPSAALVDQLRAVTTEREWLEFKRSYFEPEKLGEYLSALSNEAALANQPRGYLIFGIDNDTHAVVGTKFDPYAEKAKGNEDLLPWLMAGLQPKVGFQHHIVEHPDGRVVLFEVFPANDQPVAFHGVASIRVGSSIGPIKGCPEKARALWTLGRDWSAEVCPDATLADLDPDAVSLSREQFAVKHPRQADEIKGWDETTFLNKARVLKQGKVTNTALLLLGRSEAATLLSPAVATVTWTLKDDENRDQGYQHFAPPFLAAGDRLLERIRNLTVRTLPSGTLFPQEISQYDPWVIREALHNCIAHQDYGLHGRIVVTEFPDRLLLDNMGRFLPGDIQTVIHQDAPPLVYRNTFLATAMVELNMIDTQGGGIKRMYEAQRRRGFPLPAYDLSVPNRVSVCISGRILDERYTRLLMEQTDISLELVMLLDRVQRRAKISKEESAQLKAAGLVEGRFPNLIVAGTVARVTGEAGRHVRESGFDKAYYMDLVVKLIREHGPADRKSIDDLLLPKLPDRLSETQKRTKIHNLLQELRKSSRLSNGGCRRQPLWQLAEGADSGTSPE